MYYTVLNWINAYLFFKTSQFIFIQSLTFDVKMENKYFTKCTLVYTQAQSSSSLSAVQDAIVLTMEQADDIITSLSQQCFSAGARIFLHRFPLILHMWAKYESAGRTCRATEWKLLGQLEHC